jgi:large subunit ribosomal protein L11
MAKKIVGFVKLQLPAGKATPAPPVGPALGQHGANIMGFVKEYNAATAAQVGQVIPVEITVFSDRSFSFVLKTPPASFLITQALGVAKGSGTPNKASIGTLTWAQCLAIGRVKMADLNAHDEVAAARIIAGTARSMGVTIEGAPSHA